MRARGAAVILLVLAVAASGKAQAQPQLIADGDEFRRKCAAAVRDVAHMIKPRMGSWDRRAAFIADHLGSPNEGIRRTAIMGLRRIIQHNRPAPESACRKFYIDRSYPADVRAMAVANAAWRAKDEAIKRAFLRLVCGDVTPPEMAALGWSAHGLWGGLDMCKVVPEDKRALVARRLLQSVLQFEPMERFLVVRAACRLGEEATGTALAQWYKEEEDPLARAVAFDSRSIDAWRRWGVAEELVRLGENDWHPIVAKLAKQRGLEWYRVYPVMLRTSGRSGPDKAPAAGQ